MLAKQILNKNSTLENPLLSLSLLLGNQTLSSVVTFFLQFIFFCGKSQHPIARNNQTFQRVCVRTFEFPSQPGNPTLICLQQINLGWHVHVFSGTGAFVGESVLRCWLRITDLLSGCSQLVTKYLGRVSKHNMLGTTPRSQVWKGGSRWMNESLQSGEMLEEPWGVLPHHLTEFYFSVLDTN